MNKLLILIFCFSSIFSFAQEIKYNVAAPDTFKIQFVTSKGEFIVEAYRNWSPLGVDRMYQLVKNSYFDSLAIFRVVKNFVAQFGISNDYNTNLKYDSIPIKDEPVMSSNLRGVISFARSGVDTRSTQLFINLQDNTRLDTVTYNGVIGFPPLGKIISGIEVLDLLNTEYGEAPDQDSITVKGKEYTTRVFPNMDYIINASIINK